MNTTPPRLPTHNAGVHSMRGTLGESKSQSKSKSQNNMEDTPPLRGVPYPTF